MRKYFANTSNFYYCRRVIRFIASMLHNWPLIIEWQHATIVRTRR